MKTTIKLGLLFCIALLCTMSTCNDSNNNHNNCERLLGDWKHLEGGRFLKSKFHKDGNWAVMQDYNLKFIGKDTLDNGFDIYVRQAGSSGIVGAWKNTIDDSLWEMHYYNADFSYRYEWSDGDKGSGYYTISGNQMRVIEYRSLYTCSRDSVIQSTLQGETIARYKFTIVDTVLNLIAKDSTYVYSRL